MNGARSTPRKAANLLLHWIPLLVSQRRARRISALPRKKKSNEARPIKLIIGKHFLFRRRRKKKKNICADIKNVHQQELLIARLIEREWDGESWELKVYFVVGGVAGIFVKLGWFLRSSAWMSWKVSMESCWARNCWSFKLDLESFEFTTWIWLASEKRKDLFTAGSCITRVRQVNRWLCFCLEIKLN